MRRALAAERLRLEEEARARLEHEERLHREAEERSRLEAEEGARRKEEEGRRQAQAPRDRPTYSKYGAVPISPPFLISHKMPFAPEFL